jgi:hypothetical protein
MKKMFMTIVMIIAAGLLMTPGCKKLDNQVYDIDGDWVFVVKAHDGTEFTVSFTFTNTIVFSEGNEVGRYVLRTTTVNMEIDRPDASGALLEEAYFGFVDDPNNMTGTMTRYLNSGNTENFTWTAHR